MQSGPKNVDGMIEIHNYKYHNEHYSKPIKSSSKNVTMFHKARMASGKL